MIIYSIKNNIFQYFYKLQKIKKNILLNNSFSVEGLKEIKMALIANYIPEYILIYNKICKYEFISNFFIKKYMITSFIYKKISYRKKTGGIIASFFKKKLNIKNIKISLSALFLILEGIEKPGNLGAILRTADAVGIDAILLCNNKVDIFNPNVIRSSLGTIFTNKIVIANYKIIISWLNKNKIKIISTSVNKIYNNFFMKKIKKKSLAIIIGSESKGLSDIWFKNKKNMINIPIKGKIDSLNVSTSTAIILYEILRQKLY
ncbi:putative trmH/spoU family tRNA/rRNA methyltransferase [Candidatus Karelsulcia muelleri CARI]|uniref:Putative trmH/spoU family tRNA/rRNA methyltransferase n=1 Tax=Karelsulcia muelleri (strain CARI) TaxID=706194 RepID=E0TJA3_KARMC|nr:putative trmH/spoU family tRNA/rRNA methyltransferase [Candidatus Karelsulcia muelleri CARI]